MRTFALPVLLMAALLSGCAAKEANENIKEESDPSKWERIEYVPAKHGRSIQSDRMSVPGGWIVRSTSYDAIAQTFVADSGHTWKFDEPAK